MKITPPNKFNPYEYKLKSYIFFLDQLSNKYHHKGFDYWIETLTTDEKLEIIKDCKNFNDSLKAFIKWNWFNVRSHTKTKWFSIMKKEALITMSFII